MTERRWRIFVAFFMFSSPSPGAESLLGEPMLSLECRELLDQRNAKVKNRQKLTALVVRNKKVQEKLPLEKKTLKEKLRKNFIRLKQELRYTRDAIRYREEKLIRNGCPAFEKLSV